MIQVLVILSLSADKMEDVMAGDSQKVPGPQNYSQKTSQRAREGVPMLV